MRQVFVASCIAMCLTTSIASADDDYCDKVVARAHSDAALLFSPTLTAQGIKLPGASPTDPTQTQTVSNGGYQFRSLMEWSPLKTYQGLGTLSVGESDCKAHKDFVHAMYVLGQLADVGRLPALSKELDYLAYSAASDQTLLLSHHDANLLILGASVSFDLHK